MCECIETVNKLLEENGENTVITQVFSMSGTVPNTIVAVEKRDKDKRKKPTRVFATFFPFCGEKYPEKVGK